MGFGDFLQNLQIRNDTLFSSKMNQTLAGSGIDLNTLRVSNALENIDMDKLSFGERKTLLSLTKSFAKDGDISFSDANALIHSINEFGDKGVRTFADSWPFTGLNLLNAPGNGLFNGLMGMLVSDAALDMGFQFRIGSLLDQASPNIYTEFLGNAFASADMQQLNFMERAELTGMVSVAVADGNVSWAETKVIMDKLQSSQQPDFRIPEMPTPTPPSHNCWEVGEVCNGKAEIDLGNYTLELNEKSSEMVLTNKETGESSRIWGDPHFDMDNDGKTDVDFWGTISLNLEDGTKITIDTTPWNGNDKMTLASKLTITNGSDAIVVEGLDQNKIGDMTITQSKQGHLLDAVNGDGLDVYENANGEGWLVKDGLWLRPVTQDDMNTTKDQETDFSLTDSLQAMGAVFASAYLTGLFSVLSND
ncbi:MAG: DUF1521 domain-containing protein [Pseudomonadales bacterium]|nr:DUF1521 domain-containing protein [Pseudomonadales bacterium]